MGKSFQLPTTLLLMLGWATLMGGIRALFEFVSKSVSQESKTVLADKLTAATSLAVTFKIAPQSLLVLFDSVFGRPLSLKCLARSALFSCVTTAALVCVSFAQTTSLSHLLTFREWLTTLFVSALVLGYGGLLITRECVSLAAQFDTLPKVLLQFVSDVLIKTIALFIMGIVVLKRQFAVSIFDPRNILLIKDALFFRIPGDVVVRVNEFNELDAPAYLYALVYYFGPGLASLLWSAMVSIAYIVALLAIFVWKNIGIVASRTVDLRTNTIEVIGLIVMTIATLGYVTFVLVVF